MWVLTESYNDYYQHGDYFVTVFDHKPTLEDFEITLGCDINESFYNHLMNGGGRIDSEDSWYYLTELKSGELYVHSN